MSGIGEASAIIAVVSLGYSIQASLTTYVIDVREGKAEIASLTNELKATVIHIEELEKLLKENDVTHGWSKGGRFLAVKCITDCDAVLQKLQKLLAKAGSGTASSTVVRRGVVRRGDIVQTRLSTLTWPRLKPRLVAVKTELQKIKLDVLIAQSAYKAHVGTEAADRKAAAERIVALWRSKAAADRRLANALESGRVSPDTPGPLVQTPVTLKRSAHIGSRDIERPALHDRDIPISTVAIEGSTGQGAVGQAYTFHALRRSSRHIGTDELVPRSAKLDQRFQDNHTSQLSTTADGNDQIDRSAPSLDRSFENVARTGAVMSIVPPPGAHRYPNIEHVPYPTASTTPSKLNGTLDHGRRDVDSGSARSLSTGHVKGLPPELQDSTRRDGRAVIKCMRYEKRTPKEYITRDSDYPFGLLCTRLRAQAAQQLHSGTVHAAVEDDLRALPPQCRRLIDHTLEDNLTSRHFWRVLTADALFRPGADVQDFDAGHDAFVSTSETFISVEVVFRRCNRRDSTNSLSPIRFVRSLGYRISQSLSLKNVDRRRTYASSADSHSSSGRDSRSSYSSLASSYDLPTSRNRSRMVAGRSSFATAGAGALGAGGVYHAFIRRRQDRALVERRYRGASGSHLTSQDLRIQRPFNPIASSGIRRTRDHGSAPMPVVNVYNDAEQDSAPYPEMLGFDTNPVDRTTQQTSSPIGAHIRSAYPHEYFDEDLSRPDHVPKGSEAARIAHRDAHYGHEDDVHYDSDEIIDIDEDLPDEDLQQRILMLYTSSASVGEAEASGDIEMLAHEE